jgi:hypothetical protein
MIRMKWLLGALLVAHGFIHVSYLTPAPPRTAGGPEWPFELTRSWLVTGLSLDPGLVRGLGVALVATTVALLVGAGLATVGWLPAAWWTGLATAGALSSLATLFFHPWLVLGIAIDLAIAWAALVAAWQPAGIR